MCPTLAYPAVNLAVRLLQACLFKSDFTHHFIPSVAVGFDFWVKMVEDGSQPEAETSGNEQNHSVRSSHQSVSSTQNRSITKYDPCASCQQCDWYYPRGTFKSYWMVFLCLHRMREFNIFDRREQEKLSCGSFYRCTKYRPERGRDLAVLMPATAFRIGEWFFHLLSHL